VTLQSCSECTRRGFAAGPELYVAVFVLALAGSALLVGLARNRKARTASLIAGVMLIGTMLWLGIGLFRGVSAPSNGQQEACGTTLGASQWYYSANDPDPAHALCREKARHRLNTLRNQSVPVLLVAGVAVAIAVIHTTASRRRVADESLSGPRQLDS
jgi:hypothetical protein